MQFSEATTKCFCVARQLLLFLQKNRQMETDYSKRDKYLVKVAKTLKDMYLKRHIYGANIIEELHANENAHSRILRMLLQYQKDLEYPILDCFARKFLPKEPILQNPSFANEEGRIDLLIHDNHSAIIIENKVMNATDQWEQLDRYVNRVKGYPGISTERIYVIYLTRDGGKRVEEYSLSPETRNLLKERFVELNFKEHIFPWIKELNENLSIKDEPLLSSALTQYADFLERMFIGTNQNEIELKNEINRKMEQDLNIENIKDYFEIESQLYDLQNRLSLSKLKRQAELLEELKTLMTSIINTSGVYSYPGKFNWDINCEFDGSYFSIDFGTFCDCTAQIQIRLERGRLYSGIASQEGQDKGIPMNSQIIQMRERLGLSFNNNWFCWRWLNYYPFTSSFWENINSQEMALKFLDEAKSYIDSVFQVEKQNAGE